MRKRKYFLSDHFWVDVEGCMKTNKEAWTSWAVGNALDKLMERTTNTIKALIKLSFDRGFHSS